jgi:hypothetical protein
MPDEEEDVMPRFVCKGISGRPCPGELEVAGGKDEMPPCPACGEHSLVPAEEGGPPPSRLIESTGVLSLAHQGTAMPRVDGPTQEQLARWEEEEAFFQECILYGGDKDCIICKGEANHLGIVAESLATRSNASKLALALGQAFKNDPATLGRRDTKGPGRMIGVFHAGSTFYVSYSGDFDPQPFTAVAQKCLPGCVVVSQVPKPLTAGGARIDQRDIKEIDERSPAKPFYCAAPKLFAVVLRLPQVDSFQGIYQWFMTEMWAGPTDGYHRPGQVYPSCGNCKSLLPAMLCQTKPIVDAPSADGFQVFHTKGARKNMQSGRDAKSGKRLF